MTARDDLSRPSCVSGGAHEPVEARPARSVADRLRDSSVEAADALYECALALKCARAYIAAIHPGATFTLGEIDAALKKVTG